MAVTRAVHGEGAKESLQPLLPSLGFLSWGTAPAPARSLLRLWAVLCAQWQVTRTAGDKDSRKEQTTQPPPGLCPAWQPLPPPPLLCLSRGGCEDSTAPSPSPGTALRGGDKGGDLAPVPPAQQSPWGRDPSSPMDPFPSPATGIGTALGAPQALHVPDAGGHYQFRVIVLGDAAVGKSSLLRCYAEGPGGAVPCPTVGVDFYSRTVPLPPAGRAKLQLWDTAGQERFR